MEVGVLGKQREKRGEKQGWKDGREGGGEGEKERQNSFGSITSPRNKKQYFTKIYPY